MSDNGNQDHRIEKVDLLPVTSKRIYVSYRGDTPPEKAPDYHFLFLRLETDTGITGWGEISDIPRPELFDNPELLGGVLREQLSGQNPFAIETIMGSLSYEDLGAGRGGHGEAGVRHLIDCAVDGALYDIMGQAVGRPVYDLVGGPVRQQVDVSWVPYVRPPAETAREVEERVAEGFTAFKLKVRRDLERDLKRVRITRETAGPDAHILIDANGAWRDLDEALHYVEAFTPYIDGVETPVSRRLIDVMAALREQMEVPLVEHVSDVAFAAKLVAAGAVDVLNVSTVACGGILKAKKVIAYAEALDMDVRLGSTVELGIGTAAQMHLAASSPGVTWPCDLIGPKLYVDDPVDPRFEYQAGALPLPQGTGLGVRPTV